VRQQVKAAGGKWNPRSVVWELPYGQVVAVGLTERLVTKGGAGDKEAHPYIDGAGSVHSSTYR
jgi:hypothetical protein